MAGGDISATLRVNVVVDTSGAEAQIRDAISKINTGNNVIRLRADASDALKEIHSLQSEIQALGKKPVSFGVTSAFGKMVNNGFGAASEQLSNINKQIQALGNNGGATKSLTQVSDIVGNLKSEMSSLSEVMDKFQGIHINLGDGKGGFNTTLAYGNAARNTISQLKEQATELENFLKDYYNVQDGIEGGLKLLQGAGAGKTSKFLNLQDTMLNPKASLQDQMSALRDYIELIQNVASTKGIDLSEVTSGFSNNAAKLVEDCNKVATGEKQLAEGTEKLKNLFGGSAVNSEALNSQLESISSAIQNISTSITSLTSGEGPFTDIISSVTKATEAVEKLSSAFDGLEIKASGNGTGKGKGGSKGVFSSGTASWASKMNSATKQIESMEMFYNKVKNIPGLSESGGSQLSSYRSAIDSFVQLQDKLDNGNIKRSDYNTQLVQVAKQASEAKIALQEAVDAQEKLNASQAIADKEAKANILSKDSSAYKSSVLETTRQIEAMQSFYDKMNGIAGLDKSGENELKRYASVLSDMKRLNTDLNRGDMDRGGYISRFTNITEEASKAKIALEQVANAQKKYNAEQAASDKKAQADILTKDNPAFKSNMLQVSRQIESMEKFRNSMNKIAGLDQSGAAELEKYTSTLEKIKQLSADLDSEKMTKGDFNTRFANLAKEASEAKIELQEVADKQKQLNEEQARSAQGSFADNFVKQQNALREISKLQQEIAQNSKKWSAAEHGSSAGAYAEYIKQGEALEKLNQEVSNGSISMDEYSQRISEIKANMQDCATAISNAGENTQGFGAQLAGAFRYFSMYFGMTRMVMKGIQTVKQMVQASIDIESAMNRIQIVTGATDSQMTQFFDSASQQAQDLGQNITDVASSIETFSRLGYSLGDATDLSKYATIMSNVADTTVDAATTGLTSIIKGFGMEASDAEHVSDVLINVGQKYAISAEELMEAFERGGAAMNASGSSFEETAALFAATNASLQNASTTGTMWKTVSARLRSSKVELEEMGESTDDLVDGFSKYREEVMALSGFDIMKNEKEFKTPMQIFVGLAEVWDKLESDTARSRIAEILGGTRNLSGIASTIQNISDAIGAYEVAMNSAGVAEQANAKHMETTEAHIGQLKASFQELASDVFGSDFLKGVVDAGKGIIDVIDSLVDNFGVLSTSIGLLSTGIMGFNLLKVTAIPALMQFGNVAKSVITLFARGAGSIFSLGNLSGMQAAFTGIAETIGITTSALGTFSVAAVAAGGIFAYYLVQEKMAEEARKAAQVSSNEYAKQLDSYEDSVRKVQELRTKLDSGELSSAEEYETRSQLLDIQNQMVETYGAQASALDLVNGSLKEQQGIMQSLNVEAANKLINFDVDAKTMAKAKEVMEGTWGGEAGHHLASVFGIGGKNNEKERKILEGLAEQYKDFITLTKHEGENGSLNYLFSYKGNIKDAKEDVGKFMTSLRDAKEELGGDTPILDEIFAGAQKSIGEATELMSKYQDIYEATERAKLIADTDKYRDKSGKEDTAYNWLNDYADAINKYNNALEGGSKEERLEAANSFRAIQDSISGMTGSGGDLEQYKDQFDDVGNTLNKAGAIQEELAEVLSGDYVSDATKDVKLYGDAIKELGLSDADFLNAFMSKSGDSWGVIGSFIDAVKRAGYISSDSKEEIEGLAHSLVNIDILSDTGATGILSFEKSLEDLKTMVSEYSTFNKDMQSAFDNSKSGTGLLVEDIDKLSEAYKGLAGYDPAKLFENTYDGIHLNNEELQKLNKELSESKLQTLNNALWERQNALLNGAGDAGEIQGQINDIQNLISVYEGLNSAYGQYLNAKSGKNERDSYNTLGTDYKSMKDTLDQGWYGDDSLNAYVDLMAGVGNGVDDVAERFASLGQVIEGTNHSFMDYFKFMDDEGNITTPLSEGGAKGNLVSDGLVDFVEDVRTLFGDDYASLMDDGTYKLDLMGGKLDEVAQRFGTSSEAIQLMERAMIDAGMAMVLDNNNFEAMTAQLQKVQSGFDGLKDVDFSFDIKNMSMDELSSKRQELENAKATIDVDTEGAEEALQVIDSLIAAIQGQEYQLEIQAKVDETGLDTSELLAMDDTELAAKLEIDESGVEEARAALESLNGETVEASITVNIAEEQFSQLVGEASEEKEVGVHYVVTADPEPVYNNIDRDVTYHMHAPPEPSYSNIDRTVTYTIVTVGSPPSGGRAVGTMTSIGTAHANGTAYNAPWNWISAYANGKVSLPKNEVALVNELGTESIIRNGKWMLIPGGMHMEALKKGDIILNAAQTRALMTIGKASGVGHSYAMGSILGNAYDRGSGLRARSSYSSSGSSGGGSSGGGRSSGGGGGGRSSGGGGGSGSSEAAQAANAEAETLDWIEVLLKRIEAEIDNLETKAESAFSTMIDKNINYSKAIDTTRREIELQAQAYEQYANKARSFGLSDDYLNKIMNGQMSLEDIADKDLRERISDAQNYWDKAEDALNKQLELSEQVKKYYKEMFETVKDGYEAEADRIEAVNDLLEERIELLEEQGTRLIGTSYNQQIKIQQQLLDNLTKERKSLYDELRNSITFGDIKVGSEAYNDMYESIKKVELEIAKTNTEMQKLQNTISKLRWERFDDLQETISDITSEADFMESLLDSDNYRDEEGNLTDQGLARLGLVAVRYDTYMRQARDYYNQIRNLDKEYANDKYNTAYLKQRQEWVEDWRDAIKDAYSEREEMQKAYEEQLEEEKNDLDDLIKKKKEMLRADQEEYEYRRRVTDQQKNILALQKQLLSLQGDDSEEGAANRQKLANDLQDAQKDLQETIEDKRISDTEKLLDNLYSDYEEFINNKLDEISSLSIDEIINIVNSSQKNICDTLNAVAASVGYQFQTALGTTLSNTKGKMVTTFTGGTQDSGSRITNGIQKTKDAEKTRRATEKAKEAATTEAAKKAAKVADIKSQENRSENQFKKYGDWAYVYDYDYYRSKYKDLQKAFGDDEAAYFNHFMKYGMKEGRRANALFDPKFYKKAYPDLQKAFGSDMKKYYEHFIKYGINEGRTASAQFNFNYYKSKNADVAKQYGKNKALYYKHFLVFGQHEGRSGAKGYASGSKRVPSSGKYWTQENGDEVIIRASDNALLTKLKAGDMVLDKTATSNLWKLVNNPESYIKSLSGSGLGLSALGGGNTSIEANMTFNLPNVNDANSFISELRNSPKFEQLVQEITIGRISGNARLKKRSINI